MHERELGFGEVRVRCEGCIEFVIQNHLHFHYQRRFHQKWQNSLKTGYTHLKIKSSLQNQAATVTET